MTALSDPVVLLATSILGVLCGLVGVIDARSMRIPDALNGLVLTSGFAAVAITGHSSFATAAIASGLGFGASWLLREVHRLWRGQLGLGLGDVKFIGAAGAWLGIDGMAPMILVATLSALTWVVLLQLTGAHVAMATRWPFGPFLAAGTWTSWILQRLY